MSDLTDICEALRFVENRSQRGGVLETLLSSVHVPDCAYLPLCRSTDAFQRVLRITPGEAKAFSTKVIEPRAAHSFCNEFEVPICGFMIQVVSHEIFWLIPRTSSVRYEHNRP